jgi:hypothetical protein
VVTPTPALTPPPPPTGETIDLSGDIDEEGVVQEDVQQTAFAGTLVLYIPAGTTALTAGGEPLTEITIEEICFGFPPPPAGAYIIGCVYDYGPDGATFDPPIEITISYDPGLLEGGVDEEDLKVAYYDVSQGKWIVLPSEVDTVNHTVTATVSGFTMFAVYLPAPEVTPIPPTATPAPTPTPTPAPEEGGGFPVYGIVLIVIAAIIVVALVYYFIRRRGGGTKAEA